jgi:hypothetical protein
MVGGDGEVRFLRWPLRLVRAAMLADGDDGGKLCKPVPAHWVIKRSLNVSRRLNPVWSLRGWAPWCGLISACNTTKLSGVDNKVLLQCFVLVAHRNLSPIVL